MHCWSSAILLDTIFTPVQASKRWRMHSTDSTTTAKYFSNVVFMQRGSMYPISMLLSTTSGTFMPLGPNGICSSIMESKHIKAVKEPWRRSSRFEAMEQMLLMNQRLDKLAAAHVDFTNRKMLSGTCLLWILLKLGMLFRHLSHHLHN